MKKAIFIVGPTAVGKTAVACQISKKISSRLISADSIQVYRGADIISGKDLPAGRQVIQDKEYIDLGFTKLYLTSILPPTEPFSVRTFVDSVKKLVHNPDVLPIIVGGTGLYTKALFENIDTLNIPPNKKLREQLSKDSIDNLQKKLKSINSDRFEKMNNSDKKNPRRLIRAIETCIIYDAPPQEPVFNRSEVLIIGLMASDEELKERIKARVEERIKLGALDEAKKLFKIYNNLAPQLKVANGYKEMFKFLKGEISWEQAVSEWEIADYQHAKQQLTYFRKMEDIHWVDVSEQNYKDIIFDFIKLSFPRMRESRI